MGLECDLRWILRAWKKNFNIQFFLKLYLFIYIKILHDSFLIGLDKRNFKEITYRVILRVRVDADCDCCLA